MGMEAERVYKKVALALKGIKGVSAVGVGASNEILVFVESMAPEVLSEIPRQIDGVKIKVKYSGKVKLVSAMQVPILASRTEKWRPAPGGVSIGHPQITAGTFTCAVADVGTGKKIGLSNNHVIAMDWGEQAIGRKGDLTLQPGPYDGGSLTDRIGALERWVRVELPPAENVIDGAVFIPDKADDLRDDVLEVGKVGTSIDPLVGMDVCKSGRTCGVAYGKITALHAVVDVHGWGVCRFVDQIIVEPAILLPGDSGSWLTESALKSVGLGFAGSSAVSVFNTAKNVEKLLGIKFGVAAPPTPPPSPWRNVAIVAGVGIAGVISFAIGSAPKKPEGIVV